MNNRESGPKLAKIEIGDNLGTSLIESSLFDKQNLGSLRHILEKYDWNKCRNSPELRAKVLNGRARLIEIKKDITDGQDKLTDINEVLGLIKLIDDIFFNDRGETVPLLFSEDPGEMPKA